MSKRILFVGMYPNAADPYLNAFFQNLIYAMADEGVECYIISPVSITKYRRRLKSIPLQTREQTPSGNTVKVFYPRYISVSGKQIGKFNTRRITELLFQKCAVKCARKLGVDFDLVYGHFILDGGLAAIKIGGELNIPSFFAYGECDFESQVRTYYGEPKESQVIGLKGIVSVSTKNTLELKNIKCFSQVPIFTSPNAVNAQLFYVKDKEVSRNKFNLPQNKFIVGFVGGFIERKGDKRLLAAVESLDEVYVAFAGRGVDKPSGPRVLFCDSLEHEEVCDFLNAVDVFVLPTLSEGSCNAVIEAMACGVPVISSNLPFNYDVLNERNSICINPNSISEIAEAILKLKNNAVLREQLRENSLATARELEIHHRAKKILNFLYS